MSRLLRIIFSNVRMPRSHRMTLVLPPAKMYSAAIRNSFHRRGQAAPEQDRLIRPAQLLEQHEILLHIACAELDDVHIREQVEVLSLMISVTTGRPVWRLASKRSSGPRPQLPPGREYGEVRGFGTRRHAGSDAPARLTASATSTICASLSTEQGPAITLKYPRRSCAPQPQ